MKKALQTALLLGALLGLGFNGPALAAKKPAKSSHARASLAQSSSPKKSQAPRGQRGKPVAQKKGRKVVRLALVRGNLRPARPASLTDLEPGGLALHSASALVIDQATGQAIVDKNADAVTPIASISKLMTAMVVLDARLDLQEVISISDDDVDYVKNTHSRLPVGTTLTRETALLLALMASENRAASALGRHYPGGMPAFVAAMNRKSHDLGMSRTRFEEPTGLSSNNVSTAGDLAKMVAAAALYPEIRAFSTTTEARLDLNGRLRDFNNTNTLVKNGQWEIGVSKTGYISEAGRCLVMQAHVAGKPVVIVLLDSEGKMSRVGDANRIKRWMENTGPAPDRKSA